MHFAKWTVFLPLVNQPNYMLCVIGLEKKYQNNMCCIKMYNILYIFILFLCSGLHFLFKSNIWGFLSNLILLDCLGIFNIYYLQFSYYFSPSPPMIRKTIAMLWIGYNLIYFTEHTGSWMSQRMDMPSMCCKYCTMKGFIISNEIKI